MTRFFLILSQCRCFTATNFDCYLSSFLYVYSFSTSATTHWISWLNWKYFSEWWYYRYISSLLSMRTIASFHRHRCWFLYFKVFCDSSPRMSATTRWNCCLHWKYLAERSYYCYISSFSPSTMALFHRHICWLLYFEVFLWSLLTDECDQLFR